MKGIRKKNILFFTLSVDISKIHKSCNPEKGSSNAEKKAKCSFLFQLSKSITCFISFCFINAFPDKAHPTIAVRLSGIWRTRQRWCSAIRDVSYNPQRRDPLRLPVRTRLFFQVVSEPGTSGCFPRRARSCLHFREARGEVFLSCRH